MGAALKPKTAAKSAFASAGGKAAMARLSPEAKRARALHATKIRLEKHQRLKDAAAALAALQAPAPPVTIPAEVAQTYRAPAWWRSLFAGLYPAHDPDAQG